MFKAIQLHAEKHAMFYLITIGFGLQAFGTSFYDNFYQIPPPNMAELGWWQVLALVLKSLSFAVGIMVGYLIKPPPKEVITESDTVSNTTITSLTESIGVSIWRIVWPARPMRAPKHDVSTR